MPGERMPSTRFVDRLLARIARVGSPTCIGLDPVVERIPDDVRSSSTCDAEAVEAFCIGVVDVTAEHAAAFKPQSACFERLGSVGIAVLERVIAHAKTKDVPVILDAKRGDIGSTAEHYAQAVRAIGADAVTVNMYLGPSTIEPYLSAGLGVFVLVRTSNPDSDAVQSNELASGGTIAEMMADLVNVTGASRLGDHGASDIGAVVGLTKSADGESLRRLMPQQIFLVPGYGAQGGSAEDLKPLLTEHKFSGKGVLVNASRSVIYAKAEGNETWTDAVGRAAKAMREDLASVLG
jgi:orotidine-5'-phosphate decarboxylase